MSDNPPTVASDAKGAAIWQALVCIVVLCTSTFTAFEHDISGDAYVAILSGVLGYAFGNFRHAMNFAGTGKG